MIKTPADDYCGHGSNSGPCSYCPCCLSRSSRRESPPGS